MSKYPHALLLLLEVRKFGSSRAQSGSAQPHADLLHGTFTLPTRYFTEARSPASTHFRKSSPKDRNPGNSHEGQRDSQKATAPPVIGAVDETSALQRARETDGHERELEAFGQEGQPPYFGRFLYQFQDANRQKSTQKMGVMIDTATIPQQVASRTALVVFRQSIIKSEPIPLPFSVALMPAYFIPWCYGLSHGLVASS